MYGALFNDEMVALNVNQFVLVILNFGSGVYANLGHGANWFVKFIGYVSPFRYSVEILFRSLLRGLWYKDQLCTFYEYKYKEKCIWILLGFASAFLILSLVTNLVKTKFSY